jgi:Na+/melibiose symporter-like transporter
MNPTNSEIQTNRKTRILYSLTSLGVATPVEAISGIIAFYIVDVKNLPATWYATFWFFYTIYNAINNPALGYLSDGGVAEYHMCCSVVYLMQ